MKATVESIGANSQGDIRIHLRLHENVRFDSLGHSYWWGPLIVRERFDWNWPDFEEGDVIEI